MATPPIFLPGPGLWCLVAASQFVARAGAYSIPDAEEDGRYEYDEAEEDDDNGRQLGDTNTCAASETACCGGTHTDYGTYRLTCVSHCNSSCDRSGYGCDGSCDSSCDFLGTSCDGSCDSSVRPIDAPAPRRTRRSLFCVLSRTLSRSATKSARATAAATEPAPTTIRRPFRTRTKPSTNR